MKPQHDKFLYHELLDRLHLILSNVDDFLLDHPITYHEKKVRKKIEKASEKLADAYQEIGKIEFEKFKKWVWHLSKN